MTQTTTTARAGAPGASPPAARRATRALLTCGIVAGPWFIVVAAIQVLSRDGFDLRRHPLSALSLGDLGWIQITNFVVAGLLVLAFAVGMRRVLQPGRAGTWGPLLLGAHGVGLIAAGVFVADPALGFPAGAPAGVPDSFSWHAVLHGVAFAVAFLSLTVACLVFARHFAARKQRAWVAYCAATGVAALALSSPVPADGASVRFAVASLITWAWVTAMAVRLTSRGGRS